MKAPRQARIVSKPQTIAALLISALVAAIVVGYLFNWPASVAGHRFSTPERGPLSEWVPGAAGLLLVLAGLAQLRVAQETFRVEASRFARLRLDDHDRLVNTRRLESLESAERVIDTAGDFMAATVDVERSRMMPDAALEAAAAHTANTARLRCGGRLQSASRVAVAQLRATGMSDSKVNAFAAAIDAVFDSFGDPGHPSVGHLEQRFNEIAELLAEVASMLHAEWA